MEPVLPDKQSVNIYTLSLQDVMSELGMKNSDRLRKDIKDGKLRAKVIGNKYMFKPEDVRDYIENLPGMATRRN